MKRRFAGSLSLIDLGKPTLSSRVVGVAIALRLGGGSTSWEEEETTAQGQQAMAEFRGPKSEGRKKAENPNTEDRTGTHSGLQCRKLLAGCEEVSGQNSELDLRVRGAFGVRCVPPPSKAREYRALQTLRVVRLPL